jgi:hypothetical protein
MAIPNQPGALKTARTPPLVPLRLLAVAAAEVGITGLALREALVVAVAPTATQDLELRAKETTVVAEMVGPQATIREEAEAAQPAAEAQAAQTQAAQVVRELVPQ